MWLHPQTRGQGKVGRVAITALMCLMVATHCSGLPDPSPHFRWLDSVPVSPFPGPLFPRPGPLLRKSPSNSSFVKSSQGHRSSHGVAADEKAASAEPTSSQLTAPELAMVGSHTTVNKE